MRLRKGVPILIAFVAGIAAAILAPAIFRGLLSHAIFPDTRKEVERVTSPDNRVDAVLEQTDCGPPCSVEYSVSIVPRGNAVGGEQATRVIVAEDATKFQLRWAESRFLEIAYERARIDKFQNVAYPFGKRGDPESWRYVVEARLMPSSRFSYLTNEGLATHETK